MKQKQSSGPLPWASAAGILAGCLVTLTGVAMNLEPETILVRALIGSLLMGVFSLTLLLTWRVITPQADED
ncbi:hypothetical protein [Planctomicrobium sp. SH664]|uniref:hypothetical protein n=1 Tax=Planctomicrobium sp. SH664 TaxID=3448125 RepID=UPI003F5C2F79